MFKRILVPLDGSKLAESVLPTALDLAKHYHSTLILFHVLEKDVPTSIHGQYHLGKLDEAREYLESLSDHFVADGIRVEIDLHEPRQTDVARSISEHARELRADLIILCAHGYGGLRDIIIGSIAQQVIYLETIPVLLIRPDQVKNDSIEGFKTILVPLDGNPVHESALPIATSLALKYGADLRLLSIVPTSEHLKSKEAAIGRILPASTLLSLDLSAQESKEYLKKIAFEFSNQGVYVSGQVVRGNVVSRILETVKLEKIDLVVMASFGHRNFDAFWEESTTPKVLTKSSAPVLIMKETKGEQME
ncbi:MAG: hypothetical protein CVU46_16295 [Chloroflexi bacterium HGW-Chloroflexi-8]|nr:MAG: hypothetical protein CVU46_16295 [Chloroflexi bacterium HGW-Chloroflexi-8]